MKITKNKRVFVTGCGGMLGKAVYEKFSPHCKILATDIELNEPWLEYGDVIDFQKIFDKASKFEPDLIINLAALTDLEFYEKNPEITWKINIFGHEKMEMLAQLFFKETIESHRIEGNDHRSKAGLSNDIISK